MTSPYINNAACVYFSVASNFSTVHAFLTTEAGANNIMNVQQVRNLFVQNLVQNTSDGPFYQEGIRLFCCLTADLLAPGWLGKGESHQISVSRRFSYSVLSKTRSCALVQYGPCECDELRMYSLNVGQFQCIQCCATVWCKLHQCALGEVPSCHQHIRGLRPVHSQRRRPGQRSLQHK